MKISEIFENWLKTNSNATTKYAYMAGFKEGQRCENPHMENDNKKYFVSFSHTKGNGNSIIFLERKITSELIEQIETYIANKTNTKGVVINNFILLD
jgi:hypothetical protein